MNLSPRNAFFALALLSLGVAPAVAAPDSAPPLTVLTIGGGPDLSHNQVAIESNVRYVESLLPKGTPSTVLFADGNPNTPSVQYQVEKSDEESAFEVLFRKGATPPIRFRAPQLPKIDGATQHGPIHTAFDSLSVTPTTTAAAPASLLLYFTGHGSPSQADLNNNFYDLWKEQPGLTVKELSSEISRLPANEPVTMLMVECFSGAFGNLLFEGGDPNAGLLKRPICGYFATTRERVAAGCTPEVNEADYKDFTSYFFAALTGKNRLGKKVRKPDYNKDGKTGMDEAFAWALINDVSIDVPVATSDVFLRQYVNMNDDVLKTASYDHVRSIASPAQRAALDGISDRLGDKTPDRLKNAIDALIRINTDRANHTHSMDSMEPQAGEDSGTVESPNATIAEGRRNLRTYREKMLQQFPDLNKDANSAEFKTAREQAIASLKRDKGAIKGIYQSWSSLMTASQTDYDNQLKEALTLRFARLAKSVLLEEQLRASGDKDKIAYFDRLKRLEAGNPLTGFTLPA